MLNPNIKIAKSQGIDLPVMYVYLAGRIAGNCIEKCLKWRQDIVNHYRNYKEIGGEMVSYPIAFIDPLNSGEANSVDKLGLTSSIPPNLIYDKDELSVKRADVIVANMEDFFEVDIAEKKLELLNNKITDQDYINFLEQKIRTRRENLGTICEVAWALQLRKPLILIVPDNRKEIFEKHPFMKRASVIVTSTDQLLKDKWLQILYKSISGATY